MEINHVKHKNYLTIGNDLVNFSLERCKDKAFKQRFINKILHPNEQQHLELCVHKAINLWMIWSGKEAAFKAYQKQKLDLIFSHKKFEVCFDFKQLDQSISNTEDFNLKIYGTIKYQEKLFQAMWDLNNTTIHCISILIANNHSNIDHLNKINYKIFKVNSSDHKIESLETKLNAKKYLIDCGFPKEIEIKRSTIMLNTQKRYAPPKLFIKNNLCKNVEITLSHDHGWGAIAYLVLV